MAAIGVIIGLLFFAAAVVLLVRAIAQPRARISTQLRHIRAYGFEGDLLAVPDHEPRPALVEDLAGLAEGFGRLTRTVAPMLEPLTFSQLVAGGITRISPDAFHGYRAMFTVLVPAVLIAEGIAAGRSATLIVLLALVGLAAAWVLPASVVRRRAQARLDRIDRALPELIDVLTATVEAGLGFGGSLQLVADRFEGPIGEELRLTLQEQNMGLSSERALSNMLARCESPAMRAFVRAVLQGQALGVSVGQMMRSVAAETRQRRRQA